MTDFASLLAADRGQNARPIHLVDKNSFASWLKERPPEDRSLLSASRFDGKTGFAHALLPRGNEFEVVSVVKNAAESLVYTDNARALPQWSPQNRPMVVRAKPANEDDPGLGCFTLSTLQVASLFLCASSADRI